MVTAEIRFCVGCQDERGFEVPPCQDDHGLDCPDLACIECGHAIVVGHLVSDARVVVEHAAA